MRKYSLASPEAKNQVDLRDYADEICAAVHQVLPMAKVEIEKDCYYIHGTLEHGEAIKIGRLICQSDLKKYCVQVPKLFSSIELEEVVTDGTNTTERTGGHH